MTFFANATDRDRQLQGLLGLFSQLNTSVTTYGQTLPWNMPRGYIGSANASGQSGITTIADVTGASVTFTAPGHRNYLVELSILGAQNTSTATAQIIITDGSNVAKSVTWAETRATGFLSAEAAIVDTPAAGSVTYKARATTSAGTLDISGGTIIVIDLGPSAAPV